MDLKDRLNNHQPVGPVIEIAKNGISQIEQLGKAFETIPIYRTRLISPKR
jgi:hypothetical protein